MAFTKKQQAWAHTKDGQKKLGPKKVVPDSTQLPDGAIEAKPSFTLPTHISRVTTK